MVLLGALLLVATNGVLFNEASTTVLLRLFSSDPPSSVTQVAGLQHAVPHPPSLTLQAGFFIFQCYVPV